MLKNALEKDIFGGKLKIRILKPEDIVGLKIQAIANNKERTTRELADIEALMDYYRKNLDWELIAKYFFLFEQKEKFKELKDKYSKTK